MVVSGLLFACMGALVRVGGASFSTVELVFYRSLFGFLAIGGAAVVLGLRVATPCWHNHFRRGLAGFTALLLFFYGLTHLPLATAMTLNYTSPLFLAVFTVLWLRERPSRRLVAAVLVGFCGVVLLLRPTLAAHQWVAGVAGLASGALAGWAYLEVRALGREGEPEWRVVFYFTLFCVLGSGAWMALDAPRPVALAELPLLAGIGGTATLAQLALTRAYRTGGTLTVGSLAYSAVVFASLFGWLGWGETLSFSAWAGIAVIVAGGLLGARASRAGARRGNDFPADS